MFLPLWAVFDKNIEKELKKHYKEVTYHAHSDTYMVMSKSDKGYYGICDSKGKERIPPYYKKIAFEKDDTNEILIFALNPNYKAKTTGNIVYSMQRGEILDLGKSEPQFIKGGFITSYLKPIYNLDGEIILDCQQTSVQPLRRGLNILGYRVGSRTKVNNDLMDEVLICDPQFNILFTLYGANYLWNIEEVSLSNAEYGWKCIKKVDSNTNTELLYSQNGELLSKENMGSDFQNQFTSPIQSSNLSSVSSSEKLIKDKQKEQGSPNNVFQIKSEVDKNIPVGNVLNPNTFALIIANENYHDVAEVPNALNDGEIFSEYCEKIFGLPKENIHLVKNATLNNLKREMNLMHQIADVYLGEANFLIYYAGHGIPDETSGDSFLLPVDGYPSDLSTCYSLNDFYSNLGNFPSNKTFVFIDACFSGAQRGDGMLKTARGVALKSKPASPKGKMVVFSAAQSDETAYPLDKEKHGLFTYWLLKALKDSKGNITLGELSEQVINNVGKQSLVINGKKQTPSIQVSSLIHDNWQNWKIVE